MRTLISSKQPDREDDSRSFEERVVIVEADSFEQAIAFGEAEANRYVSDLPKSWNPALIDDVQAFEICANNLSQWKKRGYQNWLLEQSWLEQTRARQESALDLAADFDATQVNHAALQLGSLHILEALRELKDGNLDEKLGGNSAAFSRLINALCRASRETLQLQNYRQACAQARAQLQPLKDPNRKLTEAEHRAIVRKVDEILGLASPDDPPASPVGKSSTSSPIELI